MSRGLKTTFIVHLVVSLVFGLLFFLVPDLWGRIAGYSMIDPYVSRVFGAALLALGLSSWLGYRAHSWEEVRILLEMETGYTVLGTAAMVYSVIIGAPIFIWVPLVLHAAFAVVWIYFLVQEHPVTMSAGSSGGPTEAAALRR